MLGNAKHSVQGQVGALILHKVLENVNPNFLRAGVTGKGEPLNEDRSLGIKCFQELVMLGHWKKCLLLLDYESQLQLCSSFADFYNFKLLFLLNYSTEEAVIEKRRQLASLDKGDFKCLPFEVVRSDEEFHFVTVCLTSVVYIAMKEPTLYKQDIIESFPSYFYRNRPLFKLLLAPRTVNDLNTNLSMNHHMNNR